ncbi:hypothetical protein B0T17DRAFT_593350 [Bombardia bombarda]|uniref:Histone-lysine N-methyltransferase n=1 Tax=Bombardia bombarda TaxID=252184 RepID=A0AA39U4K9_9PEZI|nr:hypothetical protein B0T17DRAFT_593350 [Bombardia bombarda]
MLPLQGPGLGHDQGEASFIDFHPPTTVSPDSISLASEPDLGKRENLIEPLIESAIQLLEAESEQQESGQQTPVGQAIVVAEGPIPTESEPAPPAGRSQRARASLPVYNLDKLGGTAKGERQAKGDTLVDESEDGASETVNSRAKATDGALNIDWSIDGPGTPIRARVPKKANTASPVSRRVTRRSGVPAETLTVTLSSLGKRGRDAVEKSFTKLKREVERLKDTNEYAHIDKRPVRFSVWSNGKYVDPAEAKQPAPSPVVAKEDNVKDSEKQEEPKAPAPKTKRVKKWLDKGLYAGQETPSDIYYGLSAKDKKTLASIPELASSGKPNQTLPTPMFNGLRLLMNGRDFKLPYDVCNPLPPGQPKPAAYRTMTKNRFVGDAAAYWKKTPHFHDSLSKCVCKPEDGCAEDCQNRIMLYECDDTNCNAGKAYCQNRAFQNLQERTKKGGRYRVGVEVLKTSDRGYGVRSNRCYEPNQIITEYTGEIITEEECDRRMNEIYKDNECYYLMSFDQNMIIDATTGSIARFVNHSCSPNCRMIKWIVLGQPRMALFAGDRPITTGEELTYDYNFDPFSAKNVQKCLCGSPNCRGILGPKPKEVKPPKPPKDLKKSVKGSVKAGKRKLKELLSGDADAEDDSKAAKKRKMKTATGVMKQSITSTGLKAAKGAAKGAATAFKRSVSNISVKTKTTPKGTRYTLSRKAKTNVVKTYGKKGSPKVKVSSRSESLTIVAAGSVVEKTKTTTRKAQKKTPKKAASAKSTPKGTPKATPKKATPARKAKAKTDGPGTSSARERTASWKKALSSGSPAPNPDVKSVSLGLGNSIRALINGGKGKEFFVST